MIAKRLVLFCCACISAVMLWPAEAAAQVFVGVGVHYGHGYYRPYYPFYPFYSPFYSPFYATPYWYPYYGGGYAYSGYWASARIEVKPRNAQVYLDGYYVGVVDEFDGVFQRLDLRPGEHELTVYLPGHRSYTQRTLFRPGEGYHFKAILEPLPAGAPPEPQPQPSGRDPYRDPQDEPYGPPRNAYPPRDEPQRTRPLPERQGDRPGDPRPPENGFGTLNVRVQPVDAVIVIDGERWDSPEGGSRLVLELAAGSHRVEVRKDGFKTYSTTLQIRPGQTETLNVSLSRD